MKVIVVGCGRIGSDLAFRLFENGHEVIVIDSIAAAFANLPGKFMGRAIEGDVLNQDVLRRAGIETANSLAAVTNMDALNAVVAHVARTVYHVPNVIVRNYDPHCRPMLESFGFQVVSSTSWGAQRMEELISHAEIRTVFSSGNGEVEVYELTIPQTWHGRKLSELTADAEVLPVSLSRAGKANLPKFDSELNDGDVIVVSGTFEGIERLRARLLPQ